jgi:hypothetical protein
MGHPGYKKPYRSRTKKQRKPNVGQKLEVARPERLELPTFCFVEIGKFTISLAFAVASGRLIRFKRSKLCSKSLCHERACFPSLPGAASAVLLSVLPWLRPCIYTSASQLVMRPEPFGTGLWPFGDGAGIA